MLSLSFSTRFRAGMMCMDIIPARKQGLCWLCWMQVQDNNLYVRSRIGRRHCVGVLLIGPTNEVLRAVLVPGCAIDERNGGHLLNHDFLEALKRLLLYGRVG